MYSALYKEIFIEMMLGPREYVRCVGLGKESWGRPVESTSYHSKVNEAFSCPQVFKRKLKSITLFFPLWKNLFKMLGLHSSCQGDTTGEISEEIWKESYTNIIVASHRKMLTVTWIPQIPLSFKNLTISLTSIFNFVLSFQMSNKPSIWSTWDIWNSRLFFFFNFNTLLETSNPSPHKIEIRTIRNKHHLRNIINEPAP